MSNSEGRAAGCGLTPGASRGTKAVPGGVAGNSRAARWVPRLPSRSGVGWPGASTACAEHGTRQTNAARPCEVARCNLDRRPTATKPLHSKFQME